MKPRMESNTSAAVVIGVDIGKDVFHLDRHAPGLTLTAPTRAPMLQWRRCKGGSFSKASLRPSRLILLRKAIFPSAANPTSETMTIARGKGRHYNRKDERSMPITAAELFAWRNQLGWSLDEQVRQLGISCRAYVHLEAGLTS